MYLEFNQAHIKTLAELQALAEKHNCFISFGSDTMADDSVEEEFLVEAGFPASAVDELLEFQDFQGVSTRIDRIWFELCDSNDHTYHNLTYRDDSLKFFIEDYSLDDISEETKEFMKDKFIIAEDYPVGFDAWGNWYEVTASPTIINGFGNKETVKDFRVYRSGMAIKYFGDLVCDYLGEPRIERQY